MCWITSRMMLQVPLLLGTWKKIDQLSSHILLHYSLCWATVSPPRVLFFDLVNLNRPFYCCVLSCLVFEQKWGWSYAHGAVLMLINKTPVSLSFKDQLTNYTTVKWSIEVLIPTATDKLSSWRIIISNMLNFKVLPNSFLSRCETSMGNHKATVQHWKEKQE